jgi:DNA-binding response OmpR family regulator
LYGAGGNGRSTPHLFRQFQPDRVVLDIVLLKMDRGSEVMCQLHQSSDVYPMMLPAKADEVNKVIGF